MALDTTAYHAKRNHKPEYLTKLRGNASAASLIEALEKSSIELFAYASWVQCECFGDAVMQARGDQASSQASQLSLLAMHMRRLHKIPSKS